MQSNDLKIAKSLFTIDLEEEFVIVIQLNFQRAFVSGETRRF